METSVLPSDSLRHSHSLLACVGKQPATLFTEAALHQSKCTAYTEHMWLCTPALLHGTSPSCQVMSVVAEDFDLVVCRECGVQGCAVGEPALAGGDPAGGDQQHPVGGGDHALPHLRHEGHDRPLHRGHSPTQLCFLSVHVSAAELLSFLTPLVWEYLHALVPDAIRVVSAQSVQMWSAQTSLQDCNSPVLQTCHAPQLVPQCNLYSTEYSAFL